MTPTAALVHDSAIFSMTPEDILLGLHQVASGTTPDPSVDHILRRTGLATDSGLTTAGVALFKTAWVLNDEQESRRSLGLALRALVPIQVLEQELLQFGAVPDSGALELLRLHRCLSPDLQVESVRSFFRRFAPTGLFVYSNKYKTVRALEPPSDEVRAGEGRGLAAMVSPKTPFMNVVRLRRMIRTLAGVVWWADRHFGVRALEELAEELEPERVDQIRILSGTAPNVLTARSMKDFEGFRDEMRNKGIESEWRVDHAAGDCHDRWIGDDSGAWNMPPVNTLFKNDYSEMLPTDSRPPFEEWWARASPRT
jgi:hypothetical protein